MSHAISPYERQYTFLESGGVIATLLTILALAAAIALHLFVLWIFLVLLAGPPSLKNKPDEYIKVQFLGDVLPAAPAAPAAPVDPDIKGPDVVKAPTSTAPIPQPNPSPAAPEQLTSPTEVIPLGRPAPEKPPELTKKAPPPKVTPPKVKEEKPEKPTDKTNQDAELNKTLAELRRKVEAKNRETENAENYNIGIEEGAGDGDGSMPDGSTAGVRVPIEMERYYRHVRDIVKNNWSWSSAAGIDESKLLASMEVKVENDGRITSIRLIQSSGNQEFDISVARALNKSHPLPPLPPVFEGKAVTIQLNFRPQDLR